MSQLLPYLGVFLLFTNLVAFSEMGLDKQKAIKQKWRTPEKRLFLWVLLGGGVGGTIGMFLFHHKTKHWYFRFGFPLITLLEYLGGLYVLCTGGFLCM